MLTHFKKSLLADGEVYLRVKVRPNAGQTALKEMLADETLKIDIAAAAEKGKANAELLRFLAEEFDVDRKKVGIISGMSERLKLVKIKKY